MRVPRFLIFVGVVLVLLSFVNPMVEPSYWTDSNLSPGNYRGYVINCNSNLNVRMSSWHGESFSVYVMTYENGLKTLEEGSLDNVTSLHVFSNRTSLNVPLSVPNPGLYAILVTPATNSSVTILEVDIEKQIPNQNLFLTGASILFVGIMWCLVILRRKGIK